MTEEKQARPFHERFDIEVGVDEAKRRFINRIEGSIFDRIPDKANRSRVLPMPELFALVAYYLGITTQDIPNMRTYVGDDFYRCLRVLEELYKALEDTELEEELSELIDAAFYASEVDLGVDWQPPIFVPTGARLLDEKLVNDQLHWLRDQNYNTVREPFEKGLSHFLESEKKPQLLADVVTDMYESVEALAKIVTGRPNKDLSANREAFISKVKASDHYKTLLKDYIAYANEFRHAEQEQKPRPSISRPEAEAFVYLTGLFIRLVVQRSS